MLFLSTGKNKSKTQRTLLLMASQQGVYLERWCQELPLFQEDRNKNRSPREANSVEAPFPELSKETNFFLSVWAQGRAALHVPRKKSNPQLLLPVQQMTRKTRKGNKRPFMVKHAAYFSNTLFKCLHKLFVSIFWKHSICRVFANHRQSTQSRRTNSNSSLVQARINREQVREACKAKWTEITCDPKQKQAAGNSLSLSLADTYSALTVCQVLF